MAEPDPDLVEFVKALARASAARDFAKARQAAEQRGKSMTDVMHYHRKILDRAAEDNPNNARVPKATSKGYRECINQGWIEERIQPHAGYRYFALTEAGEAARRAKPDPKPLRVAKLKALPDRIAPAPPRIRWPD